MPYLCDFLCLCSLDGNACFVVKCQGAVKLKRYLYDFLFQANCADHPLELIGGFSFLYIYPVAAHILPAEIIDLK